ncbi:hypothetical protein KSS87_011096 [Heliosperma pusillum]|nr:hypothetical protein KSS87_011096 [Heliosperma pusillum]
MMMKKLYTTLSKTPNFLKPPTSNRLYPFSIPSFSTNFPFNEQQTNLDSHIDQNHEIETAKTKDLSKPRQIPYQSKIANWVNLIGTIKMPIKFLTCDHGKAWAATLISQEQYSSNLPLQFCVRLRTYDIALCSLQKPDEAVRMPVIFQGDLAYTAMMHLKENDVVYIGGHLSPEPVPINLTNNQANVQILVHDVHFVRGLDPMKNKFLGRSNHLLNSNDNQKGGKH